MASKRELSDVQLIERFFGQPGRLPDSIRAQVAHERADDPVQLYAYCDLDDRREFVAQWLVVTEAYVLLFADAAHCIARVKRGDIEHVDHSSSTGGHALRLYDRRPGAQVPPLLVVRYTRRQQRVMEAVQQRLEQPSTAAQGTLPAADELYQSQTARPIRDAQALVSSHRLAVLWRLLTYLKPYRGRVIIGLWATAAIMALSLLPPLLSGFLIDQVVGPVQAQEIRAQDVAQIAWFAVLGIALSHVARQACHWLRLRHMTILGEYVARDLRDELYNHLHSLSVAFFSRKKTGGLITRVSADTDRLWEFLALGVIDVSLALVMLLGLSAILLGLDVRLGAVVIAPLPLVFVAIRWHGKRMETLFVLAFRRWSALTDLLSDTLPGMRVVQAFDQGRREKRRFGERNAACIDAFTEVHESWTAFWPGVMFITQVTAASVWVFALPRLLGDGAAFGPPLSAGTFVSFLLYTSMLTAPVETLGQMSRVMNRATTSAHRIFEVLDSRPDVTPAQEPVVNPPLRGAIEFRHVGFAYDGVRQTLQDLSFVVRPGEFIGLVGPSGSGKSTIIQLLSRFYDVDNGAVLLDGVDIRLLELGQVRRQIGLVQQDPYLFHGSILDNIRYGLEKAELPAVVEAARVANAHDFICQLPHGYDTMVGERGHTLSGGERQRISIARAVLMDPRILILDEATSAVDTDTEFKIQQALSRLVTGRTVIAIAHRLSTVKNASRLLVLERGRITEAGPHQELVARPNGTYRRLYELQHSLHDAALSAEPHLSRQLRS